MKQLSHHFSHPHALLLSKQLAQKEDDDQDQKCCSACEKQLPISGEEEQEEAYTCPKRDCEFFLHKSCFELPKTITQKSHPNHKITLISEPPQFSIYFDCNACGSLINGFSFHCEKCDFKLHVKCAFLLESVDCKAHEHALAVRHNTPKGSNEDDYYNMIVCDVCHGYVTEGYWSYLCKDCDFCTHVECAFVAEAPAKEEEEEDEDDDDERLTDAQRLHIAHIKAMDQMARLHFQMQMAQLNATTTANLFRW